MGDDLVKAQLDDEDDDDVRVLIQLVTTELAGANYKIFSISCQPLQHSGKMCSKPAKRQKTIDAFFISSNAGKIE
ncbi:hypothetical protein SKAU_G00134090 [Synaphobranchus kaupii]|uniref:Uncharacterized protein n=1 Tax=Synaphobranchus kaupii TaxID=118154 RepID=A0A9Q1J3L9_SYNKA|nr:hypothetical protein SKAU_G00134090 [Synaphobranchus kaupii]